MHIDDYSKFVMSRTNVLPFPLPFFLGFKLVKRVSPKAMSAKIVQNWIKLLKDLSFFCDFARFYTALGVHFGLHMSPKMSSKCD